MVPEMRQIPLLASDFSRPGLFFPYIPSVATANSPDVECAVATKLLVQKRANP